MKIPLRRRKVQSNKCLPPSKKTDNCLCERPNEKLISKITLELGCEVSSIYWMHLKSLIVLSFCFYDNSAT